MSTRCQILVDGHDVQCYRHGDGFPDGEHGVLATLLPLLRDFAAVRGWDPYYLTAHILHDQIAVAWRWREQYVASLCEEDDRERARENFRQYRFLGFGIETSAGGFHGDEEYIYVVKRDHVEVRETVSPFHNEPALANTRVIKRVTFDGKEMKKRRAVAARRRATTP